MCLSCWCEFEVLSSDKVSEQLQVSRIEEDYVTVERPKEYCQPHKNKKGERRVKKKEHKFHIYTTKCVS